MAIMIKSAAEIEAMRRSGEALRKVHDAVRPLSSAGATTMDLERAAAAKVAELGVIAPSRATTAIPSVLCTSVNSEVIHGIPNEHRMLKDGDIVSIDCGVIVDGFYSDSAVTYPIGKSAPEVQKLLASRRRRCMRRLKQCRSAAVSSISHTLCSRCARARASASFASSSATASAAACMRIRSCRTSVPPARDHG